MFRLFLTRFWPVLLPIAVYIAWLSFRRRKARKTGAEEIPGWLDGPWLWTLIASLLLAILGFVILGVAPGETQGVYVPAHMENGKIIPGHNE